MPDHDRAPRLLIRGGSKVLTGAGWPIQPNPNVEVIAMAKTKKGNKKVHVPAHTKKVGGKKVKVKEHYRSTPN